MWRGVPTGSRRSWSASGSRPSVTERQVIRSSLAEWRGAGSGAPTVLIYGHYDVQPPEPLELWTSPPFVGTIRDGRLYARGAADDKGQLWVHVTALEACLSTRGSLPINVVMLIEGEEEIGSTSLPAFLEAHRERLACDYIVISDTMMFAPGVPNILASMRGIAYFEIGARSASVDLHSGQYGGVVANAARRSGPRSVDAAGGQRPGRDSGLLRPSPRSTVDSARGARSAGIRRASLCVLHRYRGVDGRGGLQSAGATLASADVRGQRAVRRVHRRRSQDRDPFDGLGQGELSPGTGPDARPGRAAVARPSGTNCDPGVSLGLERLHGARPWCAESGTPAVSAARRALASAFEHEAVLGGTGGTIPIVPELARVLRCRDSPCRVRSSRGERPRAERMDRSR